MNIVIANQIKGWSNRKKEDTVRATFQVTSNATNNDQMKVSRNVHKLIDLLDYKRDVRATNF